jgi:hypothetical protein
VAQPPDGSERATGKQAGRKRSSAKTTPKRKKAAAAKRKTANRRGRKPEIILTVSAGVERDLAAIAVRDQALATSGLATVARALAREIDDRDNSATSKSMCAKALQDILAQLSELAPPEEARDGVDEIIERHGGSHLRAV